MWKHVADCLKSARNGRTLAEVVEGSGVSIRQILAYESGKVYRRPPDKMWQLVNFYRWSPGSLRAVMAGGMPTYVDDGKHLPDLGSTATRELLRAIERDDVMNEEEKEHLRRRLTEGRGGDKT